jgi:hypothetical protein
MTDRDERDDVEAQPAKGPTSLAGRGRFARGRNASAGPGRPKPKVLDRKKGLSSKTVARAKALGLAPGELKIARAREQAAVAGLASLAPAQRRKRTASRLGMSEKDLALLRKAFVGGVHGADRSRAAALVRSLAKTTSSVNKNAGSSRPKPQQPRDPARRAEASKRAAAAAPSARDGAQPLTARERQMRLAARLRAAKNRRAYNWWSGGE